jgi:hypothetical protein
MTMDFAELKKKLRKDIELDEPDFIKDAEEVLNLGYIETSATQKIVISISTYRTKKYFDIRTWFQGETGEWSPTKKGIRFSFDKFEEFEKSVALIKQAIDADV